MVREEKKLWVPGINDNYDQINSNSWFDICKTKNNDFNTKIKTEKISVKKDTILTRPIRIYPTDEQKVKLSQWFLQFDEMWNATKDYIEENLFINKKEKYTLEDIPDKYNNIVNFRNARKNLGNKKKEIIDKYPDKIPVNALDQAIAHNITMYKSSISNLKARHIYSFRIRNRRTDKRRNILVIEKAAFSKNKNGFYISSLGELESNDSLVNIENAAILTFDKITKKYILRISFTQKSLLKRIKSNNINSNITRNIKQKDNTCGIDPGIRTFLTIYSENSSYSIGSNLGNQFKKYYKKIDKINSLYSTNNLSENKKKKALTKYYDKITNKVKDMHYKIALSLCKQYKTIKLGKISTTHIVKNEKSNLKEKNKRILYSLSHYKFREILIQQGKKYGSDIKLIDEYMTSQTCCKCENTYKVGKSAIYECPNCDLLANRDVNASINIFNK